MGATICVGDKFNSSEDLKIIESGNEFGIYLKSLSGVYLHLRQNACAYNLTLQVQGF